MSDEALRLEQVGVAFGGGGGLTDLNLAVPTGQRLVLLGPSGVGKTTILRAIAGLSEVTTGRITIGGREVTGLPPEQRDAVYLHQTPLLFPHLTVFENIAFPLRLRRRPGKEVCERVEQLLEVVRLAEYRDRRSSALSGGQRHRVALARALAARPRLLLLDEPLAALDPVLREDIRGAIVRLHQEDGPAVVVVTHDLTDALTLGQCVAVLLNGRLAGPVPADALFRHPPTLAVARFCGIPNQVPGAVRQGAFQSALGTLPATAMPDGPAVAVFSADALRPEVGGPIAGVVQGRRPHPLLATQLVEVAGLLLESTASWPEPLPDARVALRLDPTLVSIFPREANV